GAVRLQCLEAGAHGGLPRGPAVHRRQQIEARASCPEQGGIIGMDHGLHERDSAVASEGGQARPDDRLAPDMPGLPWANPPPARGPGPLPTTTPAPLAAMCLIRMMELVLGFSASQPSRKLAFHPRAAQLLIKWGFLQCSTCAFAAIG